MNTSAIESLLLKYHKEYETDKENLYYAKEGIKLLGKRNRKGFEGKRREPVYAGGKTPGAGLAGDEREGRGRTLAKRIRNTFIENGGFYLTGAKVSTPTELAELMQIYRNPYFETVRIIYTQGDQIVGVQGSSSFLPALCFIVDPKMSRGDFKIQMEETMRRLSADGYYITHNHPSGNIKASFEDKLETYRFQTGIKGFRGHIIIDHTEFTLLDKDTEKVFPISERFQVPVFEEIIGNATLLGETISSPEEIANIAKLLETAPNTCTLVFANSKGKINEVTEVSNGFAKSPYFPEYIEKAMLWGGHVSCFVVTQDLNIFQNAFSLIEQKYIQDVLLLQDAGWKTATDDVQKNNDYIFAGKGAQELPFFSFMEEQPKFRVDHRAQFARLKEEARNYFSKDPEKEI